MASNAENVSIWWRHHVNQHRLTTRHMMQLVNLKNTITHIVRNTPIEGTICGISTISPNDTQHYTFRKWMKLHWIPSKLSIHHYLDVQRHTCDRGAFCELFAGRNRFQSKTFSINKKIFFELQNAGAYKHEEGKNADGYPFFPACEMMEIQNNIQRISKIFNGW